MPRPRKPGSAEPKTRSRHGCTQCKARKIKCGEQKPTCESCEKTGQACDYTIKLNWDGRTKRKGGFENHMTVDTLRKLPQTDQQPSEPTVHMQDQSHHAKPSLSNHDQSFNKPQFESSASILHTVDINDPVDTRTAANGILPPLSQYAKLRDENPSPYPSPAESNPSGSPLRSSKRSSFNGTFQPLSLSDMPPPSHQSSTLSTIPSSGVFVDHEPKRICLSPPMKAPDSVAPYQATPQAVATRPTHLVSSFVSWSPRISSNPLSSSSINNSSFVPPSPAPSSIGSDDSHKHKARAPSRVQQDRRMSIESLMSASSYGGSHSEGAFSGHVSNSSNSSSRELYYGVDSGYPDFDIPFNNDRQALNDRMPSLTAVPLPSADAGPPNRDLPCVLKSPVHKTHGSLCRQPFYKAPIKVKIPTELEPLPPILCQEPMNLLYFHHFIFHTARILVPHDCSGNPFRKILPKMALKDTNLLRLLLAYSASHRARLMNYTEPTTRIGHYVENMFSTLSSALADPHAQISNTTFATAIMLASLEIISPNPFGTKTTIPWETHLSMTRKIITERGIREKTVDRHDEESYFLTRWFAYLDVLDSLSGGQKDLPMFGGDFWANDFDDDRQGHRIDCFFGFTTCCVCILAELAALAKICDQERATAPYGEKWQPSPTCLEGARKIRADLKASMQQPYQGCQHSRQPSAQQDESTTHALELTTTNESYHWAGLIYLNRRVLGKPPDDDQVQDYVDFILAGLGKLREGGTAEACMLFPMFIAGCEALQISSRMKFLERLKSVEMTGLTQARAARTLMQRVWEEGKPWEQLVRGEFIG